MNMFKTPETSFSWEWVFKLLFTPFLGGPVDCPGCEPVLSFNAGIYKGA